MAPAPAPAPAPGGGSSKLWLILGAVAAVVVIVIVLFVCWLLLWSPAAQAQRLSSSFMKNITAGNVAQAVALTGDSTAKDFLTNASQKVHGSYHLRQSEYTNGTGYYLYDLSGASDKYARTIVKKSDGKLVVNSFVFSNESLALVPGKSSDTADQSTRLTADSTQPASTQTQTTATATACLTNDDYKWIEFDKQPPSVTYDTTYDPAAYTDNYTGDMFFKPNTTQEDSLMSVYDDWADFYTHNSTKQWKFRLEGSTYGSDSGTPASQQLANARSQEVQAQLVKRGVPADRIIIDPPHNYGGEGQDDSMNQIYRRVQLTVDPTCSGTTASTSASTGAR